MIELKKLTWHHVLLSGLLLGFSAMSISAGKPFHLDFQLSLNAIKALNQAYFKATAKQYPEFTPERAEILDAWVAENLDKLGFNQESEPYKNQESKLSETNIYRALQASNPQELVSILGNPHELKPDSVTGDLWVYELTQENLTFQVKSNAIISAKLETKYNPD